MQYNITWQGIPVVWVTQLVKISSMNCIVLTFNSFLWPETQKHQPTQRCAHALCTAHWCPKWDNCNQSEILWYHFGYKYISWGDIRTEARNDRQFLVTLTVKFEIVLRILENGELQPHWVRLTHALHPALQNQAEAKEMLLLWEGKLGWTQARSIHTHDTVREAVINEHAAPRCWVPSDNVQGQPTVGCGSAHPFQSNASKTQATLVLPSVEKTHGKEKRSIYRQAKRTQNLTNYRHIQKEFRDPHWPWTLRVPGTPK